MGETYRIEGDFTALAPGTVRRAQSTLDEPAAALAEIAVQFGPGPFALIALFVSADRDADAVAEAARGQFPGGKVIGATTAGEIGIHGYLDGAIVAFALPSSHFRTQSWVIGDLARFADDLSMNEVLRLRSHLAGLVPSWPNEFAFLLSDGLSLKEDQLVSALGPALGETPLFGGSAGDGVNFKRTRVLAEGTFRSNRAVLTFIRTRCRVRIFRFDHLIPTDTRMVVTEADPENRLVRQINAEPAAEAYARAVGMDPGALSPFIFAAHPVVVRMGGKHHVCAIQRIEPDGDLRFFSAIDEGLVLTLAQGQPIAPHLENSLEALSPDERPDAIIACECILRRLEIEETQVRGRTSAILAQHNVVGFNSYGEQFNMLHVNQTFTGVAIYPPEPDRAPL